jgi:5-methyltetrahydropteroyltriglutamate--homocysteine methyltransferase
MPTLIVPWVSSDACDPKWEEIVVKHSTERILTTHAGSLPRPDDLLEMIIAKAVGSAIDEAELAARVKRAVGEIVRQQSDVGIDIIDDGEMAKPSFLTYVTDRLGGFERDPAPPAGSPFARSREFQAFPEAYAALARGAAPPPRLVRMLCTGPITYKGQSRLEADLENLRAALRGLNPAEVFVPSVSPTSIEDFNPNHHYKSGEEYVYGIADAMREEYKAIIDAGFLLQIDDPHLATYYVLHPELSIADVRRWAETRVAALNHALRGLPEERIRWHTCYGINIGPRVHDIELRDLVDIVLKVRAGAYSFEAANPRHEHEWRVWSTVKLPEGKILIPGVITHSSVLVEHPETVSERILRYASVVGRENVIAGSDCGFASTAETKEVHPSVVWAKMASLVAGARIASRQLWGRG